jgi:hypothetical protein
VHAAKAGTKMLPAAKVMALLVNPSNSGLADGHLRQKRRRRRFQSFSQLLKTLFSSASSST